MTDSHSKGMALERSVESIEKLILNSDPSIKDTSTFNIERDKKVIVEGVMHEIDIYVEIQHSHGYDSKYIFECKNWDKNSVGKNEIIVFSAKINALNASKGFFIATSFSRYAQEQAKQDERIILLDAKNYKDEFYPFPKVVEGIFVDSSKKKASVVLVGENKKDIEIGSTVLVTKESKATLNGEPIDIMTYINDALKEIYEEETNPNNIDPSLGKHTVKGKRVVDIEQDVLICDSSTIVRLEIDFSLEYQILEPIIVSNFNIENRGRHISIKYKAPEGQKFGIEMTAIR